MGSWDSCLDILSGQMDSSYRHLGHFKGRGKLIEEPFSLQSLGEPFSALEKYFYPSAPWQLRGSKCCADYSKSSVVVGGTVSPVVILSIINATAVKCNKLPKDLNGLKKK